MNQLKVNFLNWRPDQDEYQLEGLTKAQNVVHDTEGYKPVYLQTTSSFNTAIPANVSCVSVVARQGVWAPTAFTAYIEEADQTTPTLRFGYFDSTTFGMYEGLWDTTGYPTANAFATAGGDQEVIAFDHCNMNDKVFLVAVGEQSVTSAGGTAVAQTISALALGSNWND